MRLNILFLACACGVAFGANARFNGYWDITVHDDKHPRAWWLKIEGADTDTPKGEFISAFAGDLNKIEEISIVENELVFGFRPKGSATEPGPRHLVYRAHLVGEKLEGTFENEGQSRPIVKWTGVRAPVIKDKDDGSWRDGETIELFNGKDLSGWHALESDREFKWSVHDGVLTGPGRGANIITDRKFWNFKLHVEYKIPPQSNSGIGLRARYEVQIRDTDPKQDAHSNGALYSRIPPRVNATKPAEEWQTYDIRLVGREVTVVLNGQTIIDKGIIEGLTAMATDPNEGEPGALSLQGDHGAVEFRSIRLTTLVKR
jgi:3-keto-disaccharide hydrolase